MPAYYDSVSIEDRRPPRRRRLLRLMARAMLTVVALLFGSVVTLYSASEWKARRTFHVPAHAFTAPTSPAAAVRGQRLADVRGCHDCHGAQLAGRVMIEAPAVGRVVAPNLTTGGVGAHLSDTDWERAVRHGVRRDGTGLLIMPSHEFAPLTDEDLGDIVAYARSLPANAAQHGATALGPVMRALDLGGQVIAYGASQIDHTAPHTVSRPATATREYGAYVASTCTGCHGPGLSGGKIPGGPPEWVPAANITPAGIGHYTYEHFARVMRTGVRPGGGTVNDIMPWKAFRSMTDVELQALWVYLQSVSPRPYGQR